MRRSDELRPAWASSAYSGRSLPLGAVRLTFPSLAVVYGRACPSRGLPQPESAITTRPNHPLPRQGLHLRARQRLRAAHKNSVFRAPACTWRYASAGELVLALIHCTPNLPYLAEGSTSSHCRASGGVRQPQGRWRAVAAQHAKRAGSGRVTAWRAISTVVGAGMGMRGGAVFQTSSISAGVRAQARLTRSQSVGSSFKK